MLAGWLLVAATAVSVFHPGGLAGPFPFADVTSWPRLLFYDSQQRPWAMAGLLVFAAVLALLALRLRLRAVVALWCLLVAVAVAGNGPLSVGAWVMALVSAPMPLTALVVTGLREARAEAASHAAATEEERARRLLLEERAVIARELHDVVAHHMSVVAIQAEAAPYRVQDPPPELAKAFADVRENAVVALAELRRVLGVVRAEPPSPYGPPGAGKGPDADPDTDPDTDADADTAAGARGARELTGVRGEFGGDVRASRGVEAPQPTLAGLDALLAGVRAVGPYAAKTVTGEVRQLPRGVELSAYRIVQEALSNAMRHAPGAEVGVELAYERDGLGLRVVNGPSLRPPSPSPGAGHGLTGMRERVAMLGGRLRTGPTGEGGYEVRGFLPCEGHLEPGTVAASPAAPVPGPGEERTDG
ncbi:sensor histidine kinase [Streptomyces nanshensis]|uniref:sensor histidine kinase n=1 Tax=Streptomyces nanshensis TaxID=518642 RepID=UPI00085C9DAE|nr:histidine kinase [Streptomyces nanshensis]